MDHIDCRLVLGGEERCHASHGPGRGRLSNQLQQLHALLGELLGRRSDHGEGALPRASTRVCFKLSVLCIGTCVMVAIKGGAGHLLLVSETTIPF